MTVQELRGHLVKTAREWLGYSEANGKFKGIIDLYNTQRPLPRGYAVQYDDEWCATYVTAVGIQAGLHDIILGECSCSRMIELYRAKGLWQERDDYRPEVGDIIMYYWKDGKDYATTDCTKPPNHVGIVAARDGNTITVIEGNKGEAVAYRTVQVNGRYIRGYCRPDYVSKATEEEVEEVVRYERLKDIPNNNGFRDIIEQLMDAGILGGDGSDKTGNNDIIDLSHDMVRNLVLEYRGGAFDRKFKAVGMKPVVED